ncbi:dihydroxyacetone kinase [Diaminobutyricimonas aerilata]|uniref:Dihydroxyacetone kinase n=1 Tax=Diaminobutyricimonas aerilata TaxID=1162967 RepID=A0A2M9CFT5_9MICO|nr:dihydroxyacetone kinase family protein [Diaminobutyricimonas aerilata]PJJ70801.1 dihydroxyacetone kinase [Diaminobutyricimonas aerilata]
MTRIHSDPDTFVDDALTGFALANADRVRRVDGGVVRAHPLAPGNVAVVVGGGSGHYPAFAGVVGVGMAAGAVCGNIFTSPSAGQAVRVARAAEAGGGVLFSYGNYAGDVLHFGEAERKLREDGIDVRTVLVTDDVASAPVDEIDRRRGIAGDFCVFRIAGAAAERGDSLDEVERLARRANAMTRSHGVAFAGCTLPGAAEPLFTVPEGMMSIGLGIHGEPGVRDVPMQRAPELARTLLEPLLAERPEGAGRRATLLVNGLGTVKYEELFVLYRYVADELAAADVEIVAPECGELVTSLDMAGVSLTLMWLEEELEQLWLAPASAPAFRRGSVEPGTAAPTAPEDAAAPVAERPTVAVGEASIAAAGAARNLLHAAREAVRSEVDALGALDAVAGDGDHGVGMLRGLEAACRAADDADPAVGIEELLDGAGSAWSEKAGGTSGALWGAALGALGAALGDRERYTPVVIGEAVAAAAEELVRLGGAEPGDKTMVDAVLPYRDALARAVADGAVLAVAARSAADVARAAADETAALTPRKGRARPLAERSVGHPDPGAISFALIAATVADVLEKEGSQS